MVIGFTKTNRPGSATIFQIPCMVSLAHFSFMQVYMSGILAFIEQSPKGFRIRYITLLKVGLFAFMVFLMIDAILAGYFGI